LSVIGTESECGVYLYSVGECQTNKPGIEEIKKCPVADFWSDHRASFRIIHVRDRHRFFFRSVLD
jgi:hypothetical protein